MRAARKSDSEARRWASGGACGIAIAAPKVGFVGESPAQRVGGQADRFRQFDAEGSVGLVVQPQFFQLCADAGVGRRFEIVCCRPMG